MTIAEERIDRLTELAVEAAANGEDALAAEYAARAKRIAERHRLPRPDRLQRYTCDRCGRFMSPGRNARIRVDEGRVVITCECGEIHRYPYR